MNTWLLWGQADPASIPLLALKRWFSGLTLSSPDPDPNPFGFYALLAGLAATILAAIAFQGPRRALRQFFDVPGHIRLLSAAIGRLRRATRLVAVLLGAAVFSWTAWQARSFADPSGTEDLAVLLKNRSVGEIALQQGNLAALTPFRDLAGLGDTLVLLIAAVAIVFRLSADRWGGEVEAVRYLDGPDLGPDRRPPSWTTVAWGLAGFYVVYRAFTSILRPGGVPLGGIWIAEVPIVLAMMLVADALLLAWVLRELVAAGDGPSTTEDEGLDEIGALEILPGAVVACLAVLPARYAATAAWLTLQNLGSGPILGPLATLLRGPGLIALQAASLPFLGLVAVASRRDLRRPRFFRLLRAEGGRIAAITVVAVLGVGGMAALAYAALLAMPAQPWVLKAADAYSHFATLPIGLVLAATFVELSGQLSPTAEASRSTVVIAEDAETFVA